MLAARDGADLANQCQSLLEWYRDMGVAQVIDEVPVDWRGRGAAGPGRGFQYPERQAERERPPSIDFKPPIPARRDTATAPLPQAAAAPAHQHVAVPPRRFPSAPPDEAATSARDQAARAESLAGLRRLLEEFDGCGLKATAKNLCFFRGSERARLMVIGEAPGRDEDIAGRPFIGPAGQLLDRMLAAIGHGEATTHITNIVYWRPPGNRTPTTQEGQICRPFLERQIELVAPEVILLLGGAAAKHMFDTPEGIMKVRGTWRTIEVGGTRLRTMASLHPAYLLRTPAAKRQAWQDLLAVRTALDNSKG